MSFDGYSSDGSSTSISHDAPSPVQYVYLSPPRRVQLRSRIITYADSANPNPYQPTPSPFLDDLTSPFNPINPSHPVGFNAVHPTNPNPYLIDESTLFPDHDSADTYSSTSSLPTASSSPSTTESLNLIETEFLGFHRAREILDLYPDALTSTQYNDDDEGPPERFYMLTEHELRGLDAEIYGHLDPDVHGLTFSRRELRQLFAEAEARWRTPPRSPVAPVSSSSDSSEFSWEGTHRREERQRIFDAWEEFRNRLLPSPGLLQEVFEETARGELMEPVEEVRHVEATRTSRRRNFDEVDPDSEDEAEVRGRSRRRMDPDFGNDAEPERPYRGRRRVRRQSFEERVSLQEMDERMRVARERRVAEEEADRLRDEAAAEAQVDETIMRLRDEGFFGQRRTTAQVRAQIPGLSEQRIRTYRTRWTLMLLESDERRRGFTYTAEELRADHHADYIIERYLTQRPTEVAWRAWVQSLNLQGLEESGLLNPRATANDMRDDGMSDEQITTVLERNREIAAAVFGQEGERESGRS